MRQWLFLVPLSSLVMACSSGGGGPAPIATSQIGSAGGTLEITSGPLTGTKLVIPPGALPTNANLSLGGFFAQAQPAFTNVGKGIEILGGTRLLKPASLFLPFSKDANKDISVLMHRHGEVFEIGPANADKDSFLVEVRISEFGQFWPVERYFEAIATADYLPLQQGNEWTFKNGVKISMTSTSAEPNLAGASVIKCTMEDTLQTSGFYLQPSTSGAIESVGEFATARGVSYQYLHAARPFLPRHVNLGQTALTVSEFNGYEPLGSTKSTFDGMLRVEFLPEHPKSVETEKGVFTNLLSIRVKATFGEPTGQSREQTYVLTLAQFVGPVAIELDGNSSVLASGKVDGSPIGE